MGSHYSGGPDGIDPFGVCPRAPVDSLTPQIEESLSGGITEIDPAFRLLCPEENCNGRLRPCPNSDGLTVECSHCGLEYGDVEVMVKGKRHRIPFMESVQIEVKTPQGGTEIIRRYITVKTLEREPEARGQVAADAVAMIEEAIEILEHVRVLGQKRKNKGRLLATIICQLKTYIKTL